MRRVKRIFTTPPCVTDLLFNLVGFLFFLLALANFKSTKLENEQILKELRISEFVELSKPRNESTHEQRVVINLLYKEDESEIISVDGKEYDMESFSKFIGSIGSENIVALRCDERIRMGFHDRVLAVCKQNGIGQIRQMVKKKD